MSYDKAIQAATDDIEGFMKEQTAEINRRIASEEPEKQIFFIRDWVADVLKGIEATIDDHDILEKDGKAKDPIEWIFDQKEAACDC